MEPEDFRAAGHELIDWIADFRTGVADRPVKAAVRPGEVRGAFPSEPPTGADDVRALLDDLDRAVVPGTTMVQHPMHFGWFPSNAALSSVLGDLASSGLGALGISWESAPALTEVEEVVCDWMRQLTGLSDRWHGSINDTASSSTFVAMLAARERATDHAQTGGGLGAHGRPLVVYTTDQAHSSVRKAALLAGVGADELRMVEVDPWTRAMRPDHLRDLVEADVAAGRQPMAVVVSVGSTGTTAFDPVDEVAAVCADHAIWLHVDAAMAGSAMLLPECRHLWHGVERADSVSWNPHKWMGTILDCSLLYVTDPEHLVRVFSTNPSYLRSTADGEVTQYRDWGIPLGRRFRALKLWFHLRLDGVAEIQTRLRRDLANAQWLAAEVERTEGWEVVAPVLLQTVCVRHRPLGPDGDPLTGAALDDHTTRWLAELNDSGRAYCTGSVLDDRWMVRVSIGVEATERRHVEALWHMMRDFAET